MVQTSLRKKFGFTAGGDRAKVLAILSAHIGQQVPWSAFGPQWKLIKYVRWRIRVKRLKYKIIKEQDGELISYGLYRANEAPPEQLTLSFAEEKIVQLLSDSGELTLNQLAVKYYERDDIPVGSYISKLVRQIERKAIANNAPYRVVRRRLPTGVVPRRLPTKVRLEWRE